MRRRKRASARVDTGPLVAGELEIRADQFQAFVRATQRGPHPARVRGAPAARPGQGQGAPARGDLPGGLGLRDGPRRPLGGRLRPQGAPEAREGVARTGTTSTRTSASATASIPSARDGTESRQSPDGRGRAAAADAELSAGAGFGAEPPPLDDEHAATLLAPARRPGGRDAAPATHAARQQAVRAASRSALGVAAREIAAPLAASGGRSAQRRRPGRSVRVRGHDATRPSREQRPAPRSASSPWPPVSDSALSWASEPAASSRRSPAAPSSARVGAALRMGDQHAEAARRAARPWPRGSRRRCRRRASRPAASARPGGPCASSSSSLLAQAADHLVAELAAAADLERDPGRRERRAQLDHTRARISTASVTSEVGAHVGRGHDGAGALGTAARARSRLSSMSAGRRRRRGAGGSEGRRIASRSSFGDARGQVIAVTACCAA